MTIENPGNQTALHRDRSSGLVLCGLVEILLAVLCALLAAVSLLMLAGSGRWGGAEIMTARDVVPSVVSYGLLAVFFVWLGVGTIRARRWARTLGVVVGWIWLLSGFASLLLELVLWPMLGETIGDLAGLPPQWISWLLGALVAFTIVVHVLLPGGLLWFLRRPDVAATCAARGPERQWGDDLSPHLLSLSLVYILSALSLLLIPLYGLPVPVFGALVDGAMGAGLVVALLAGCGWLTVATLRRRRLAWYAAMLGSIIMGASTIVSFSRWRLAELLAASSLPQEELRALEMYASLGRGTMVAIWTLTWLSLIAYLWVVRSAFDDRRGTGA